MSSTLVRRTAIAEILRARGLNDRADWVERELAELVDIQKNSALLQMLHIDPSQLEPEATSPLS